MSRILVSQLVSNNSLSELDTSFQKQKGGGFENVIEDTFLISFVQSLEENGVNSISYSVHNTTGMIKFTQSGVTTGDSRIIQNGNNSVNFNSFYLPNKTGLN